MYTCNQGKGWKMGHCYVALTIITALSVTVKFYCSVQCRPLTRSKVTRARRIHVRDNFQVCSLVSGDILETHEPSITYAMVQ